LRPSRAAYALRNASMIGGLSRSFFGTTGISVIHPQISFAIKADERQGPKLSGRTKWIE